MEQIYTEVKINSQSGKTQSVFYFCFVMGNPLIIYICDKVGDFLAVLTYIPYLILIPRVGKSFPQAEKKTRKNPEKNGKEKIGVEKTAYPQ